MEDFTIVVTIVDGKDRVSRKLFVFKFLNFIRGHELWLKPWLPPVTGKVGLSVCPSFWMEWHFWSIWNAVGSFPFCGEVVERVERIRKIMFHFLILEVRPVWCVFRWRYIRVTHKFPVNSATNFTGHMITWMAYLSKKTRRYFGVSLAFLAFVYFITGRGVKSDDGIKHTSGIWKSLLYSECLYDRNRKPQDSMSKTYYIRRTVRLWRQRPC